MRKYLPLFMTSTARSGSYLISMMLSTNNDVTVASEPYLELFRSMRNAFIRHSAPIDLQEKFDPESPIQDYYFTDERIKIMDVVQSGNMSTPFDPREWDRFLDISKIRATLQCAELIPHIEDIKGSTYKEMFDKGLEIIARSREATNNKWVGIKDAWTIEFFAPLARAYPDARFIVILRDPRAVINSMMGVTRIDPLQVAHALSYARHWRKYIAFTAHYKNDPIFANRIYVLTHEQVLENPEKKAREMCDFLEVDFDPAMLDTNNYYDFSTGEVWIGNSSFEDITSGISIHRAERWRTGLNNEVVKMVDFICDPDMGITDYKPVTDMTDKWPSPEILNYIIQSGQVYSNWRSDLGDPQQDFGFELFRRALITVDSDLRDVDLIRRCFLFEDVYYLLRQAALVEKIV